MTTSEYTVFMANLSVRFRNGDTYERLKARAGLSSVSGLAERLIDEGLRMDAHPGIVFRDGPAGRRAGLAAGPDVWEVVAAIVEQKGSPEKRVAATAELLGLPVVQVRTAVRYGSEFSDEIDDLIERNEFAAAHEQAVWESEQRLLSR